VRRLRQHRGWMQHSGDMYVWWRYGLRLRARVCEGGLHLRQDLVSEWMLLGRRLRHDRAPRRVRHGGERLPDLSWRDVHGGRVQRLLPRDLPDRMLQRSHVRDAADSHAVRHRRSRMFPVRPEPLGRLQHVGSVHLRRDYRVRARSGMLWRVVRVHAGVVRDWVLLGHYV
jgi:hypothetical protein